MKQLLYIAFALLAPLASVAQTEHYEQLFEEANELYAVKADGYIVDRLQLVTKFIVLCYMYSPAMPTNIARKRRRFSTKSVRQSRIDTTSPRTAKRANCARDNNISAISICSALCK